MLNVYEKTGESRMNTSAFESHHAKTGLLIFVVIPKEDLAGTGPTKPSFGVIPTIEMYYFVFTNYIS